MLLIELALFESRRVWSAAFARLHHIRTIFAGDDKAATSASQMLQDIGQLLRSKALKV